MVLARAAKRPPRQIAEPSSSTSRRCPRWTRLEVAGPGFINVFLVARVVRERPARNPTRAAPRTDAARSQAGQRVRLEFVSANPTGPLVIVNARAAAIGDSLARLLRAQGAQVTTEFYINDAGNAVRGARALVRGARAPGGRRVGARCRRTATPASISSTSPPSTRASTSWRRPRTSPRTWPAWRRTRIEHLGRCAVDAHGGRRSAACSREYGVEFDVWSSEQRDVRDRGLPEQGPRRAGRRAGSATRRTARSGSARPGRRGRGRRQGSGAAALQRRADLLRGGHRLSPLREVRRRRPPDQPARPRPPRLRRRACARPCRRSATRRRPSRSSSSSW